MNNARDELVSLEPTEGEMALERELRGMAPWSPSSRLRELIEAEAATWQAPGEEPALRPVRRLAPVSLVHALSAVAAAAALVGLALMPLWMTGKSEKRSVAEGIGPGERSQELPAQEPSQGQWLRLDTSPGSGEPQQPRWQQYLIGSEYEGVVEPEEGPPMWRVRYQFLNRASWQDRETGAMREHFSPEERVFFVPVRHQ